MKIKNNFFTLLFLVYSSLLFSQSIWTNPITGTNPNLEHPYLTGQTVNANITVSGIVRGSGISGTNANERYNANNWNTPSLDNTAYFEFTLTPNSGFNIDFTSFVYSSQASGTGPTSFAFRSSLDSYAANIGAPVVGGTTISLSAAAYQNITTAITFRFYGWGTTNAGGTFSINDFTFNGTVAATPPTCNAPGSLAASGITSTTANVSWGSVSGAVGYQYLVNQISTAPTGSGTATTNLTEPVSGLTPSTTYYLHVRTNCGSGNFSSWTTISFSTPAAPCVAPTGLAASNITDMTADVQWNAVSGAVGYEYVVDQISTDPAGAGTATTNLTESVSGLTPLTTYYLHVRGNCGSGNFSPWTTISFMTLVTPCDAPINLSASNITDMTADVAWDAVSGAVGYEYAVDQLSTDPAGAGTATTNLTESVSGLTPLTTYYLHVRGNCGSGNFSPWTTISFMTLVTPCDAPINLSASNITDMTADVAWDAVSGAVGYEYAVDQLSTDPAGAGTATTNLTESVSGLTPLTTYYLHVRGNCGSGNFSPWTTISFMTLVTPCDAPINLSASNITDMTADVAWDAVSGAVGYEYVVDQLSTDPAGAGTATTNLTESVSGLTPLTTYYLHVRGNCGSGNFSPWTTISFMTLVTPCDAPINLSASNITDMTADVAWDAVSGAVGYEYVVDEISTDPTGSGTATTNLTESVSGLTPLTTYYLHVRGNCGSGNFSPWTTISFVTLVTPCDAPINLSASNITDMTADVAWDAVSGAVGYEYVVDQLSTDPAGAGTATTNLTESVSGLNPLTTNYLHVRGNCGSGNFSPWTTISFMTLVTPCDAPINLSASNITDMTADVAWDAVSGAVGYEYVVDEISTDPTGSGSATTNLTASVSGLNQTTTYYLHVRTDCGSGNFSPWTTISFVTAATPTTCASPLNLSGSAITAVGILLDWDAPTGAIGYEYVVNLTVADPIGAGTPTTALSESVSGLNPSTTYYVHVRTNCGGGNFSSWVTLSFTTDSDVGLNEDLRAAFSVYPNPAKNMLTIEFTSVPQQTEITLMNLVGEVVYVETLAKNATIDVSSLTRGIYFLRIQQGDAVFVQKIIKD